MSASPANWPDVEGHFLSAYISKSYMHLSLKCLTANCNTKDDIILEFGADQTKSYEDIHKIFSVKNHRSSIIVTYICGNQLDCFVDVSNCLHYLGGSIYVRYC